MTILELFVLLSVLICMQFPLVLSETEKEDPWQCSMKLQMSCLSPGDKSKESQCLQALPAAHGPNRGSSSSTGPKSQGQVLPKEVDNS